MTEVTADLNTLQKALAARLIALAEDSLARGEVQEAERLYREVLHFLQLILPATHVEIGKTLYKLAYILEFQEKNSESLDLIRQARAIMRGAAEREDLNAETMLMPFVWERTS